MVDRYFEWNKALVQEYFREGSGGRSAFLPVDDDEIVALAEDYDICPAEAAVEDFIGAVRVTIRGSQGQFAVLSRWARHWREQHEHTIPPYVAGLAFCVLAASRMEGDDAVSPNNYYDRLNKLLGGSGDEKQPENFDLVQLAWEDLSVWLDEDCGKLRGASTVRTGAHRHIGYPIGQCLLRAIDRRRLPDFFEPRGLRPDDAETISDEHLFNLLGAWASRQSCPLSGRAIRAITAAKGRDREEIVETVRRELSEWDGSLRDSRGRKRYPLRLHLMPQAERSWLTLIAELPDSEPDGIWMRSDNGQEVQVEADPTAPGWSEPLEVTIDSNVLANGLKLICGDVALSYDPSPAIPFREDEGGKLFDSFLSQHQTSMWRSHWAVVRRDLLPILERYIRTQTSQALESNEQVGAFPKNWALAGPFEFVQQPAQAPAEIANFSPRQQQSISLRGGLRISSTDSIYLVGGEPDLLVSVDEAASASSVEIDDHSEPLDSGSRLIPLREMDMNAGQHAINTGVRRTFTTVHTLGDVTPRGAGSLGLSLRRHSDFHPDAPMAQPVDERPSAGQVIISGACIRGEPEDLPSGGISPHYFQSHFRRCVLIGAAVGEFADAGPRDAPKWIAEIGLGSQFQFVEIRSEFDPAWRLFETEQGHLGVELLGCGSKGAPATVETARDWFEALHKWSSAETTSPAHQNEWDQFVEEALGDGQSQGE
jgi:hypothetical protein